MLVQYILINELHVKPQKGKKFKKNAESPINSRGQRESKIETKYQTNVYSNNNVYSNKSNHHHDTIKIIIKCSHDENQCSHN